MLKPFEKSKHPNKHTSERNMKENVASHCLRKPEGHFHPGDTLDIQRQGIGEHSLNSKRSKFGSMAMILQGETTEATPAIVNFVAEAMEHEKH